MNPLISNILKLESELEDQRLRRILEWRERSITEEQAHQPARKEPQGIFSWIRRQQTSKTSYLVKGDQLRCANYERSCMME